MKSSTFLLLISALLFLGAASIAYKTNKRLRSFEERLDEARNETLCGIFLRSDTATLRIISNVAEGLRQKKMTETRIIIGDSNVGIFGPPSQGKAYMKFDTCAILHRPNFQTPEQASE